jgi:transposase-like protein
MAGRPKASKFIVEPNLVLSVDDMMTEDYTLLSLIPLIATDDLCIIWLARHRLLANAKDCVNCGVPMRINKKRDYGDGVRWMCTNCKNSKSIRDGSFFTKSKIPLPQLVLLSYFWSNQHSNKSASRECHISKTSTIDWFNFLRDICNEWLNNNPPLLGGIELVDDIVSPVCVELDETVIRKRKYHVGRRTKTGWLFGGVDRNTGDCFLCLVPNRLAVTLLPIIQEHVKPGTHILTDGFVSYNDVSKIDGGIYQHSVVIHAENFVSPMDYLVHTQNIESMWSRVKRKFKNMHGTNSTLLPSYLREFEWRSNFVKGRNTFACLLVCISEQYHV